MMLTEHQARGRSGGRDGIARTEAAARAAGGAAATPYRPVMLVETRGVRRRI